MRVLVAGITGQLGHGLVEVAGERGVELVPLARAVGRRDAPARIRRAFRDHPELAERTLEGDVTAPRWGLPDATLRTLAREVDVVLDLAGETNWAAPTRRLLATNVTGATQGHEVARALRSAGGERVAYCYASSIHAAGGRLGRIPEAPFDAHGERTPYEQSKWLAERRLLDPVRARSGPPVGIARVGGLVGHSVTGATAKRNSLYMLADRWDRLPGRVLPVVGRGRVDMLPRDVAADLLLRFVERVWRSAPPRPEIGHVCAGEAAPTTAALLAALRAVDAEGRVAPPRAVPVPARPLVWASQHVDRFHVLSTLQRNALMGLRYLALDRVFERGRLARLVGGGLPAPTAEQLARLAFELPGPDPVPWRRDEALARFAG